MKITYHDTQTRKELQQWCFKLRDSLAASAPPPAQEQKQKGKP